MTNEQINIAIAEACGWKLQWQNQGGAPLLKTKPQGHCWEIWFDPTRGGEGADGTPVGRIRNGIASRL